FDIDSRTSDAVALAVRFGAPIYVYDFIMDAAGIVIESNDFAFLENLERLPRENTMTSAASAPTETEHAPKAPYFNMSDKQLETNLKKAIEAEQYETAAKIRDEIDRRKNG